MDPSTACQKLINDPPNHQGVLSLAGIAPSVSNVANVALSLAFVQAAARQLPVAEHFQRNKGTAKTVSEICNTLSYCLSNCTAEQINESNILTVLWNLHEKERHLTCVHPAFLDAVIGAKQYQVAEQYIINSWPTPDHTIGARDVLWYYYLRGIVHMGCENYILAIRCFTTCICFPSVNVVSAISVAAWKKYILLQCIVRGDNAQFSTKDLESPHNIASPLQRLLQEATNTIKACSAESVVEMTDQDVNVGEPSVLDVLSAYMSVANAFAETDRTAFDKITREGQIFVRDGNLGLVQRVDAILLRRQLYRTGSVFSSISIQQLAEDLGQPAERLVSLLSQVREERQWNVMMEGDFVMFPGHGPRSESAAMMERTRAEVEHMRKLLLTVTEAGTHKQSRGKLQSGGEFEV